MSLHKTLRYLQSYLNGFSKSGITHGKIHYKCPHITFELFKTPYHFNFFTPFLHVFRGSWIADPHFNSDMWRGWGKPSYVINACQLPPHCIYSILSVYMLSTPAYSHYLEIFLSLFVFVVIFIQTALLSKCINILYVRAVFKSFEASHESARVKPRLTAIEASRHCAPACHTVLDRSNKILVSICVILDYGEPKHDDFKFQKCKQRHYIS